MQSALQEEIPDSTKSFPLDPPQDEGPQLHEAQLIEISCSGLFFFSLCCLHGFQEGAFALVFKSIHYPGEAVATRLVKAHFMCNSF